MPYRKRSVGRRSTRWARVRAVFRKRPVAYGSTVGVLLGLSALTALSYQGGPVAFGLALIHLAPALVVALTNFRCRLAGQPADWPPWLLITGLLNAVIAAGVLVLDVDSSDKILAVTLLLAILVLIGTTVTWLFSAIERALGRIPRIGRKLTKRLSAPNLYAWSLVSLFSLLLFLQGDFLGMVLGGQSNSIAIAALFGVAYILVVLARRTLWDSGPLLLRWLPHIPAWITLTVFLAPLTGLGRRMDSDFVLSTIILTTSVAVLYWALLRLRRPLVEPLPEGQSERAESIQSRVEHYIDLAGHSHRLQASVQRSDGGVFGVTGVRGAGKSALTRHLLAQFERNYFTLEVTAPVRHDPDLGFFISVCRAVCRKTLDDLAPILRVRYGSVGGKLWQQIRNPALILLTAVAVFSLALSLVGTQIGNLPAGAKLEEAVRGKRSGYEDVQDPLLGEVDWYQTLPIEAERQAVDDLLTQIDLILGKEADQASSDVGYLLVPASTKPDRFWLLWHTPETDAEEALFAYRAELDPDYPLLPSRFSFSSLPEWQQQEWLKGIDWDEWRQQEWLKGIDWEWRDGYYREVVEADFVKWAKLISRAKCKLAAPFAHLSRELGFQLRSFANGEQEPRIKLVSELVLAAFADADPRLAFDRKRLRQFREVLRVYRRLLDGDVIPRAQSTPDTLSPGSIKDLLTLFWIAVAGILLLILTAPVWRTLSSLARALMNRRYLALAAEAEGFLEQLIYRSSRESSTGLSWKGISLGRKQTLAARDLTLPGLTARYTRFLGQVRWAYNGKAVIAIDELDKIHDPEQVKKLLTEIKGALFVPGTFYIISISEDAARSFRRRLASGRDIFESTFDEIIDIRQMGVATAVAMLERREGTGEDTERLPGECLEVTALFGGGIPREIIRARRILSFTRVDPVDRTRHWAARTLLTEELEQWEGHLGEANLSGADTIEIRRHARAAAECLKAGDDSEATYGKVWEALEPCIEIIDPEGLRHTVGYQAEGMAAKTDANSGDGPTSEQQAAKYRHIAGDLQALLRLLILTHLGERLVRPGESWGQYETRILACHRALADKPALAETLLRELRESSAG